MLTNATFLLQVTMKSPQILMNLKLKAIKRKNMETRSLPLQNVQKVPCKCWFDLIKHTPFIRYSRWEFPGWEFSGGDFPRGSLIGGNFLGRIFPGEFFLEPILISNLAESAIMTNRLNLLYCALQIYWLYPLSV